MTQDNFKNELKLLKQVGTKELYKLFHEMQFEVLHPQWKSQQIKILPEITGVEVLELFGPRSPELPEWYEGEIIQEISKSIQKEVLVLHHVLDFLEDPQEVLKSAQSSGFKFMLIHDSPKDGSFRYHATPDIPYFKDRHLLAFQRHRQNEGNKALDSVLRSHTKFGWNDLVKMDSDFTYQTDLQKILLVKMELALDLIEHRLSGHPTRFDEILPELVTWCFTPNSQAIVKGCSQWVRLRNSICST